MTFLIDFLITFAVFTLFVFLIFRNSINTIFSYPPDILKLFDKLGRAISYAEKIFVMLLFGINYFLHR